VELRDGVFWEEKGLAKNPKEAEVVIAFIGVKTSPLGDFTVQWRARNEAKALLVARKRFDALDGAKGATFRPRTPDERSNMKKQLAMPLAKTAPPPPETVLPLPEEETDPPAESIGLSPERINDRASMTSHVLRDILLRDQQNYHLRHWGINE
jgi:hypothetical protein